MIVFDRYIIKKENEYFVLEEVINPDAFSKSIYEYDNNPIVLNDPKANKLIDIEDFLGKEYVSLKLMSTKMFLSSEFMKKFSQSLCGELDRVSSKKYKKIYKRKNRVVKNRVLNYKLIKDHEFLTGDFLDSHKEELFNSLKDIEKILENDKEKGKSKILRRGN